MLHAAIFAVILFLTNVSICTADVPALFRQQAFNAATLAMAVNHFVAIGEDATVKELDTLAAKGDVVHRNGGIFNIHERIGWVCRVLFAPKGQKPLRPPRYGALALPYASMPLERWSLFPLVLSGDTHFVLSEGYSVFGHAEPAEHYVSYCRENGIFRRTPVQVPTREQAMNDAVALRQTDAWKAIEWPKSNQADDHNYWGELTWKFIQAQAESIPTNKPQRFLFPSSATLPGPHRAWSDRSRPASGCARRSERR
jgi:hypothetical protein